MGFLLDANILIAILDPEHTFHGRCQEWFESTGHRHWHTCPTTQNGVIRVLSGAGYPSGRQRPNEAIERLESLLPLGRHQFLADKLSMLDRQVFNRERLGGTKQVTDTYLLGLAVTAGVTLATTDRRIDAATVFGSEGHLLVLS